MTKGDVDADRGIEGDDMKESFEIGREDDMYKNQWPTGSGWEDDHKGETFKDTMLVLFDQCHKLNEVLMRALAVAMGLGPDFFDGYVRERFNTLRLLHYPAATKSDFEEGRVRAGAHCDYGHLTFLFQDMNGGLQVERPGSGAFIDIEPIKGTAVVNAGDLLAIWSNDYIRSTMHRVVKPSNGGEGGAGGKGCYRPRYSIAYFCAPDDERRIEALPGTWEKVGRKYEAIRSGEYMLQRLKATFK